MGKDFFSTLESGAKKVYRSDINVTGDMSVSPSSSLWMRLSMLISPSAILKTDLGDDDEGGEDGRTDGDALLEFRVSGGCSRPRSPSCLPSSLSERLGKGDIFFFFFFPTSLLSV